MKYCSCMCTSELPTSDVPYEKSQHEKAATRGVGLAFMHAMHIFLRGEKMGKNWETFS